MINCLVYNVKTLWNMLIAISQSQNWRLQIASFVQPTVQNPENSSFNVVNNKDKQQISTFRTLEPVNVWHFCWKNYF